MKTIRFAKSGEPAQVLALEEIGTAVKDAEATGKQKKVFLTPGHR